MPSPHVPEISLISKAFPNAIAISIVVFAVHISMAKIMAKKFKYQIDSSQVCFSIKISSCFSKEFYAVGLSSVLSSVFPVYPVTSAVGRTMVNVNAGSKTQVCTGAAKGCRTRAKSLGTILSKVLTEIFELVF